MKVTARFLFFCCLVSSFAPAVFAQEQQFANLGDFKLASGEMLHDCRVGYRTFGALNSAKSNAVLIPTWANGTTEQMKASFAANPVVNGSEYFVIAVDALSNGVSSSPSNSASQPRMKFPKITVRDMVNSQYQVLTRALGIEHLRAVIGISMGGMQTFEWMIAYPTFMDVAIPIVGSPRLAPYDLLLWQTQIDAIVSNPAWNGGDYTENPSRLVEFELGALLLTSPQQYNKDKTRQQVFESLAQSKDAPAPDANNKIRQAEAMMALDVSKDFGGSMERAAAAVKAKVFVIVARKDHVVTPQPALDFAALLHARVLELDSDCGHSATACESATISAAVASFLLSD